MPPSTENRALPLVMTGLTAGALGTIPLSRLPRVVRTGYVLVPAVLTAGATYGALRSAHQDGPKRTRARAAVWSVALGGLAGCAGAAGLWADRAIEDALTARHVPGPRLVMGLASGAVMTALSALELREDRPHPDCTGP